MKERIFHNKLIRDLIPQVVEASGNFPVVRQLDSSEFLQELRRKLLEETREYMESDNSPEEIADILEVLQAIAAQTGLDWSMIEQIREKKKISRGGFEKGLFLESVERS